MKRLLFCIGLACTCILASPAFAADSIFARFTDIDGESTQKGYEKWIEVLSYSWGASNPGSSSSGGGGAGKVSFEDFTFTKLYDVSSVKLLDTLATGKHIAEGLFDLTTTTGGAGQETYLQYKFSDVVMASYNVGGFSGGGLPTENWSLTFGKVQTTYRQQDAKTGKLGPPVVFTWDLTKGGGGVAPIPEPSTWALLMAGLLIVVYFGRNRVGARR